MNAFISQRAVAAALVVFGVGLPMTFGADRVVLVSVDGLRPDALDLVDTPTFDRLIAGGAWSPVALCDLPPATLPNHTTMLTGLYARTHGVLANFEIAGHVAHPTIFALAAEAGLSCAFFASKDKLGFLAPPELFLHRRITGDMQAMNDAAVAAFRAGPADLTFVHYRQPDSTGHASGWLSPEYLDAVRDVDRLLGELLGALEERDLLAETTVLVTADHGGQGTIHLFNTPEVRYVPWIASGPEIAAGRVICQEIHQPDTAATVLELLGLNIPETFDGQPVLSALAEVDQQPCTSRPKSLGSPCMLLMAPAVLLAYTGLRLTVRRPHSRGPRRRCNARSAR